MSGTVTRLSIVVLLLCLPLPALASAAELPNVLLVTVDTLRADALHAYGYPDAITPNLDRLASEGALFLDTITTIGKTGPAFASMFTSLYPPTHGARRNGMPLRPDVPVMAEILKAHGYQTAAIISNWTLRANLSGLARGFDVYDQDFNRSRYLIGMAERDAEAVTRDTLAWLRAHRAAPAQHQPLFLWVHYSEPHSPYQHHEQHMAPMPRANDSGAGWSKRWRYASEVAYTDAWIGRLLDEAEPYLPRSSTLVAFLADHGESLGEHGYWGHGRNTHWPNLKVPFLLAGPGLPRGRRVSGPATVLDLLPTLLDLLDLEAPKGIEGSSLRRAFSEGIPARRRRYALGERGAATSEKGRASYDDPLEITLQTGTLKAVYDFSKQTLRYYDLAQDPTEEHPLERPPGHHDPAPHRLLVVWYRELGKYASDEGELSTQDLEQLRALGYVGH